ncbi:MAG: DUF4142 domain-containing protein [Chryseosolibacter sp.]
MKTNKWIYAIVLASLVWVACDDDDETLDRPSLNDADETYVEKAARSNMAEIKFGELAATKATDSVVRAYAQEMVTEHTTAQNELEEIADDFKGVEWPNDLDEGHDEIKNQLDEADGYSFDSLYISTQVMMHEDARAMFATATTGSTEARVKAYASKYLPHIEMHLEKADSIQAAVTANGGTDDGTN